MSNQALVEKLVEAITSTECLAAFLGAFAAFLLEAMRRWRSARLANLAAGNEAVFAFSQMYTLVTNLNNQMFLDRAKEVKSLTGRDPHYIEYLPMEVGSYDVLHIPMDRLGFLLGSYDPDILNRIAACDREFTVLMRTLEQRNLAHVHWQQASGKAISQVFESKQFTYEKMENAVGLDLSHRVKTMTEALQSGLPRCASDLKTAAQQLTYLLSMTFPTKTATGFDAVERQNAVSIPPSTKQPRLWRRIVRAFYRVARTPIRWPSSKVSL